MNENNVVNENPLVNLLSGLSSGDKGFALLLFSMICAYGVKRYFDSTDKAMEHGYNTTARSTKYGEIKFEHNQETETSETEEHDSFNEDETKSND